MVGRKWICWALLLMVLLATRSTSAGPISFSTGDAEKDMPANQPGVVTLSVHPNPFDPSAPFQPSGMAQDGQINGWEFKDVRLSYDQASDTMSVGVNFWGVGGQPMGALATSTQDSIAVGFGTTNGKLLAIAGVPYDKRSPGPGIDGFTVVKPVDSNPYDPSGPGLGSNFSTNPADSLNSHNGGLAFDPSGNHPDFEFTLKNFSQLGIDPTKDFSVIAFAGSVTDQKFGEDNMNWQQVPAAELLVPEPATLIGWASLVVVAATWHGRRRRPLG